MLRLDVVRPNRLITEASKHLISSICRFIRKAIIQDFVYSINFMGRIWIVMSKIDVQSVRHDGSASTGYVATLNKPDDDRIEVKLDTDHVDIETDLAKIELHNIMNKQWNVADKIWKELAQLLNQTSKLMQWFLSVNFNVVKFHPFFEPI